MFHAFSKHFCAAVNFAETIRLLLIDVFFKLYEHGEKSTKYFLNLEKRKAKSHIRKIITDDLRETSDPEIIMSTGCPKKTLTV